MANEMIVQLVVEALRMIAAIVLPAGSLYAGIEILDRLTSGI
jgi:hypothetical protein